jgi:hypothetical protein
VRSSGAEDAARCSAPHANASRNAVVKSLHISVKISVGEAIQHEDPIGYGELQRTKRLINAAVRLWELRRESPQYSSHFKLSGNASENQSNRLSSSAISGSSRSTSISGLASDSPFGVITQGERASERAETDTARAEQLVTEALAKLRWREADLALHQKGHQSKVAIARHLRAQTPMTYEWIANRLHMGSRTYVVNLLAQSG